ncbi:MAG: hypothetical protein Q9191_007169 [Dirinaria sp. TL-2023a]
MKNVLGQAVAYNRCRAFVGCYDDLPRGDNDDRPRGAYFSQSPPPFISARSQGLYVERHSKLVRALKSSAMTTRHHRSDAASHVRRHLWWQWFCSRRRWIRQGRPAVNFQKAAVEKVFLETHSTRNKHALRDFAAGVLELRPPVPNKDHYESILRRYNEDTGRCDSEEAEPEQSEASTSSLSSAKDLPAPSDGEADAEEETEPEASEEGEEETAASEA